MNGYITRVADEIADTLLREGIDYVQSKAVFRAARIKAGLHAPKETRNAPARLTLEEQLRFIDAAYARNDRIGLMVQTLLETGTRVSEFVALRVEDVGLGERTITVENGKGGKRREIPIRAELAGLLAMHIGNRRAGPLFLSRQKGRSGARMYTRQRICWRSACTSPTSRSSSDTKTSAPPASTPRPASPCSDASSIRSRILPAAICSAR